MDLTVPKEYEGKLLSEFLEKSGYPIFSPCGGRGICGKCTVTLANGERVRACQTKCRAGMKIPTENLTKETYDASDRYAYSQEAAGETKPLPKRRGAALDIGTTSLALALIDLETGDVCRKKSCLNPQGRFGADVVTRIAQSDAHLSEMQGVLLDAVREITAEFSPMEKMTAVGNPTMLSIFCGVSPAPMGRAPFTPAFLERRVLDGKDLGLAVGEITLLPGASAYVGADVLAGIAVTEMTKSKEPSLLLDLGTNGEMALFSPEECKLYVTSTAAGPALEGANISCGAGGTDGAVCKVHRQGDTLCYETVSDKNPAGICGSGLMDLTACLLEDGTLDESGALEGGGYSLCGVHCSKDKRIPDASPVLTLTQKDIRELQLAKSAVRAGAEVLLHRAGISEDRLHKVYLAGGMGFFLNGKSAVRIGLLPESFSDKIEAVGNSALKGAVEALCGNGEINALPAICETVDLNGSPEFSQKFMEYMFFPEDGDEF